MEPEAAMLGYVELAERLAIGWTRDGKVEDYEPPAMADNDQVPIMILLTLLIRFVNCLGSREYWPHDELAGAWQWQ